MNQEPIWSVSAVNRAVKETLEGAFMPFWLGGEIGSLILHRSGHAYFQLKDDKSQLHGCFFGGAAECRRLGIDNGSLVEVWGNLSVYEVRGEYQFNIRKMRLAGLGDLQRRFEELKQKLDAEGLFARERKKAIPMLPGTIGVISSPTGAAIRDFLQILTRRFPNVQLKLYPALVQGAQAAAQVAKGVEFFNRNHGADVIVITRGGGSMEDLWPFNEEILARAVAASEIPVISAVGHEIDFTICDFVADLRVPTPSAAAELVIGQHDDFIRKMERFNKDLDHALQLALSRSRNRLTAAQSKLAAHAPLHIIEAKHRQIDELDMRGEAAMNRFAAAAANRFDRLEAALNSLNPRRQLERGYAIAYDRATGKVVSSAANQAPGKALDLHFADGILPVEVRGE